MESLVKQVKRKWTFIPMGLLLLLLSFQFLTVSGFCYSEFRYLSKRELVDRYLWGTDWPRMTTDERQEKLRDIKNYPNCCRIHTKPWSLSSSDVFLNGVMGRFSYGIETHLPNTVPENKKEIFFQTLTDIDACGLKRDRDRAGISEDEQLYNANLHSIAKHWKEIGYDDVQP